MIMENKFDFMKDLGYDISKKPEPKPIETPKSQPQQQPVDINASRRDILKSKFLDLNMNPFTNIVNPQTKKKYQIGDLMKEENVEAMNQYFKDNPHLEAKKPEITKTGSRIRQGWVPMDVAREVENHKSWGDGRGMFISKHFDNVPLFDAAIDALNLEAKGYNPNASVEERLKFLQSSSGQNAVEEVLGRLYDEKNADKLKAVNNRYQALKRVRY